MDGIYLRHLLVANPERLVLKSGVCAHRCSTYGCELQWLWTITRCALIGNVPGILCALGSGVLVEGRTECSNLTVTACLGTNRYNTTQIDSRVLILLLFIV